MSANNQVIIRKNADNCLLAFDVGVDIYAKTGIIEKAAWNNGKPVFKTATLESAIREYHKYCRRLAENGMYVEHGLAFEGI